MNFINSVNKHIAELNLQIGDTILELFLAQHVLFGTPDHSTPYDVSYDCFCLSTARDIKRKRRMLWLVIMSTGISHECANL